MRISSNVNDVIKQLKDYERQLNSKLNQIITRLSEEGLEIAQAKFMSAQYAGINDVTTRVVWQNDLECYIVADGEHVLFIEFGSGTFFYDHPLGNEMGYTRGTYGKGQGANPPWEYSGYIGDNVPLGTTYATDSKGNPQYDKNGEQLIKTMGNPPAMAMYEAGSRMHQRVEAIAREVFG